VLVTEVGEAGVPPVVGREQHRALPEAVPLHLLGQRAPHDRARHPLARREPARVEAVEARDERLRGARPTVHRRERQIAEGALVRAHPQARGEHRVLGQVPAPVVVEHALQRLAPFGRPCALRRELRGRDRGRAERQRDARERRACGAEERSRTGCGHDGPSSGTRHPAARRRAGRAGWRGPQAPNTPATHSRGDTVLPT
jgi:hypothetical protein